MALSRLLLLCMLASEVRYAETKPIDFVCSRSARRAMNIGTEMETALNNCNSSAILPAPVQIPCTELHVASWERKSHHERRQDISASLKPLLESIKVARSLDQAECGSVLLQKLEHNINSYLLILTHLQLSDQKGPVESSELSCVPRSTLSLSTVLLNYRRLITGKLERLMMSLESTCAPQRQDEHQ
ncbi:thrombopoietin isoform X2 [Corythoichthys intestinalis]|uniref:thrombopoietin isoform X2 n=1 Tax=Corythoichthys intestinalis TaxID=161448 RepID=UPI0025A6887C|nr:thrombopoietin isoform X2 [Corythoichthys intestinalis]